MLTKFESKSNRVKGLAFHPQRPWILASLHNGSIQWWDYRMGTLLDRFDEHEGPVRAISFHPSQPIFVSGGDDYKIRVWNYKQRKCLFTLHGHLDFIRTVQFHHEAPWIVSASDDYTIRIWNWQARACLAVLTGHHHYVMSAQFHPKDDLIVSASYDFTIRVWDFSGLRKKHFPGGSGSAGGPPGPAGVSAFASSSFSGPLVSSFANAAFGGNQVGKRPDASANPSDIFGSSDAVVKYVLEGHDKCVNWASFHPSLPLIVSGGDDRQIKIWRMSETKAWEVDTFRGHFNNVSNVLFHPRLELVLSAAEDKTIRVWDMAKRSVAHTFRREHDRFWIMVAHPSINLFAAGHDSGLIVFKLERERPALSLYQNSLVYVNDKNVNLYDIATSTDSVGPLVKRGTGVQPAPRMVSFNPTERLVAVTVVPPEGVGSVQLYALESQGEPVAKIPGHAAAFVARNRLAVLDKTASVLNLYDTRGTKIKDIQLPVGVVELFYAGIGKVLVSTGAAIELWDVQQGVKVAELSNVASVKYVTYSADMSQVALLSKHVITLAHAHTLQQLAVVHETIRVKSATFDGPVLVYSTLNHVKYALPNGDNGILCTLDHPLYLVHVANDQLLALSRDNKLVKQQIDGTEYRFKRALIAKDYPQVLHIINNSNLLGQSIIAYLQKKGYPEVALHFVQDPATRLDLALECGQLEPAHAAAEILDSPLAWKRLSKAALLQGNVVLAELAMQKVKDLSGLSFLYAITGQQEKLAKMLAIAQHRGDPMAQMQNAILLGSIEDRARVLAEAGLISLAWLTCHTHGLTELAAGLAAQAGLTEEALQSLLPTLKGIQPESPQLLVPPRPLAPMAENWPLLETNRGYFASPPPSNVASNVDPVAQATEQVANLAIDQQQQGWGLADDANEGQDEAGSGGGDWGFDLELPAGAASATSAAQVPVPDASKSIEVQLLEAFTTMPMAGMSKKQSWLRGTGGGTPIRALDHIVAGSFESAMSILNRVHGITNFGVLRIPFLIAHAASSTYLPTGAGSALELHISSNWKETGDNIHKARAVMPVTVDRIVQGVMAEAGKLTMQSTRIVEAVQMWHSAIHALALISDDPDVRVKESIDTAREYIRGLTIEIHRREIEQTDARRSVELACYFAQCELKDPAHRRIAIQVAISQTHKAGYMKLAAQFASALLEYNPAPALVQKATQLIAMADAHVPSAELPIVDYDPYHAAPVCAISLAPIRDKVAVCSFCRTRFRAEYAGRVCTVCSLAVIKYAAMARAS